MARSTTGGQHSFAKIPSVSIQRSSFDRSCGLKTTFDAGKIIPIFCDEVLPGDTMNLSLSIFARLATPLHPIMDNMYMDTQFFSVPLRLLWDNWQKFNGEQDNPGDSVDFLVPTITSPPVTGYAEADMSDYFGIPTGVPDLVHSALWHRAYNLIYNQWYRDENLQDSVPINKDDGPDDPLDYKILRRGKRHDYFSSALPFPQKGPSLELPLAGEAPVSFIGSPLAPVDGVINAGPTFKQSSGAGLSGVSLEGGGTNPDSTVWSQNWAALDGFAQWDATQLALNPQNITGGIADLSQATAATINQIREAFQIQRLFERDARGGSRYTEIIRSHFGVISPDARLQRPEYLGGGSSPVNIQVVAQTSGGIDVADNTPQGNLAGYGTAADNQHGFTKSFTEHCVILGFVSVRADLNYQQGLDRMFSRRTRFDFFWPSFAGLGEQEILNKEIFAQGSVDPDADDAVFGYQERYAEYRYKPSKITGQMRSQFATSLDTWHLAQDFENLPTLGGFFIEENPPIDRIIAVPSEPHFLLDCFFKYRCARPMPMYGVPGGIDRF